jgi:2'-5' RNA ligase
MRLFTAIDIPAEIKQRLHTLVERLRPSAKLSWSPIDNLHITIKFIGEWPQPRLHELKDVLAAVPSPGALDISVRGLGWFPNPRNPKVFWAGIEAPAGLAELARSTDTALSGLGVPVEPREFHPHLTLARRRKPVPIQAVRQTVEALSASDFGGFRATSFFLYLSAAGKYTKLQEVPLISTLC